MKKIIAGIAAAGLATGYAVKHRKEIAATVEAVGAQYRMATDNTNVEYANIEGVNVVVQDDAIKAAGSMYGVAGKNVFGEPNIFVSKDIFEAPSYVRNFIVFHEQAHVKFHLHENSGDAKVELKRLIKNYGDNVARSWMAKRDMVSPKELEADMYAAEQIGFRRAISALHFLHAKVQEKYGNIAGTREIENRIKALKEASINAAQ